MTDYYPNAVEKLATGIEGFDLVANGGLPSGRTTLVSGTAGSAKTVFAVQFIAEGIAQFGEAGVFVTFEETPDDIRRNVANLGWDIAEWENNRQWVFVDASLQMEEGTIIAGSYDLGALLARIEYAVQQTGATRVVIDSLSAVFTRFSEVKIVRDELFRITSALRTLGVTVL